jgi:hypothetical protein
MFFLELLNNMSADIALVNDRKKKNLLYALQASDLFARGRGVCFRGRRRWCSRNIIVEPFPFFYIRQLSNSSEERIVLAQELQRVLRKENSCKGSNQTHPRVFFSNITLVVSDN